MYEYFKLFAIILILMFIPLLLFDFMKAIENGDFISKNDKEKENNEEINKINYKIRKNKIDNLKIKSPELSIKLAIINSKFIPSYNELHNLYYTANSGAEKEKVLNKLNCVINKINKSAEEIKNTQKIINDNKSDLKIDKELEAIDKMLSIKE